MLETGKVLDGTYKILEVIGRGGGGIVYKAAHLRLGKTVAVKKVADHVAGRINVRGEADILKNLHHTYLPQVYDFLEIDGGIYTVMDYIPGYSLDYYLKQKTAFTLHQVLTWSRQLLEAVVYLHSRRPPIIHRDIKPSNIMITPEGNVCLIDFNISFGGAVKNDILAVSGGYSPPEQVLSFSRGYEAPGGGRAPIDERSDIYSIGATMYHMVTGGGPDKDFRRIRPISDYKNRVPDALAKVIERAMAPAPENRYPTAVSMLADLDKIREKEQELRKIKTMRYVSLSLGMIFLAAFLSLAALGWQRIGRERLEKYAACVRQMESYSESESFRQAVDYGIDILEKLEQEKPTSGLTAVKADMEAMVAEGYLELESYGKAAVYYENAIKDTGTNTPSGLYRDYATALIGQGKTEEAEKVLSEHKELAEEDVLFVRGVLASADGNEEEAAVLYCQAAEKTDDETLYKWAMLSCGKVYVSLAGSDPSYYEQALVCYSTLLEKEKDSPSVYLSLAGVYRAMTQYSAGEAVLAEAVNRGLTDYRIYGTMALLLCEEQELYPMESRNYNQVKTWYEKASSFYSASGGEDSSLMRTLDNIIKQLYEGGWLTVSP